ncbi:hypothetical protein T261_7561 [Streptomyces lydicus]|nr:hypothetical protein T261_7561 [Streptomyces lydicus]
MTPVHIHVRPRSASGRLGGCLGLPTLMTTITARGCRSMNGWSNSDSGDGGAVKLGAEPAF